VADGQALYVTGNSFVARLARVALGFCATAGPGGSAARPLAADDFVELGAGPGHFAFLRGVARRAEAAVPELAPCACAA
jgi:hypothetical protein